MKMLLIIISLLNLQFDSNNLKNHQIKQIIIDTKKIDDNFTNIIANKILDYSFLLKNKNGHLWLACLIKYESQFNPGSVGDNNRAYGLGQLHKPTIDFLCKTNNLNCDNKNLFDIDFNLFLSSLYLSMLEKKFNNIHAAIVAYNSGANFVETFFKKYNRLPNTTHYIKIKDCVNHYKKLGHK